MRSFRELLVALLVLAGCGTEWTPQKGGGLEDGEQLIHVDEDACNTTYLDYNNFGAPFVLDWCRGCHSKALPAGMRQEAPATVNFDTEADVHRWAPRIAARAASVTPSMPPAGGPTEEERRLLAEWLTCGMR